MTAQTSFERFRFGYGTKQQFDTPHRHYGQESTAEYLEHQRIKCDHVAVTLCFRTEEAATERPEPNADIVDQVCGGFEKKLRKARLSFLKKTQSTCAATELSSGGDLATMRGVSRTYVTFRLPLGAYETVNRLVSAPIQESSLDSRPHTRHQSYQYAPAP